MFPPENNEFFSRNAQNLWAKQQLAHIVLLNNLRQMQLQHCVKTEIRFRSSPNKQASKFPQNEAKQTHGPRTDYQPIHCCATGAASRFEPQARTHPLPS